MEEKMKNLCAPIPTGLHARVREEQEASGKTLGQHMAWLIQTFYKSQVKEENIVVMDKRTAAFQVPGELFEKFKVYLQERGIGQDALFLDYIHRALVEAQEERVGAEADTNTGDGMHLPEEAYTPEDNVEPEGEPDGNEGVEESSIEERITGRDSAELAGSLPALKVLSCSSTQIT